MTGEQVGSLLPALSVFLGRFRKGFRNRKSFEHLQRYLVGLMSDLKRKSIEPIALASGVAVRSLQEFLSLLRWRDGWIQEALVRQVADRHGTEEAIGVLDESGHSKQGDKTPGVQRQYCGETGKIENCVVGVHLVYTDNDRQNPFTCALDSDLYLPKGWLEDADRLQEAHVPKDLTFRPKWRIGVDLIKDATAQGVRLRYVTFDEVYGQVPEFWTELARLGQWAVGEVPRVFLCWATEPKYHSLQTPFAPKPVERVATHSRAFRDQAWKTVRIKDTTRGPMVWKIKAARVWIIDSAQAETRPTERAYWLIVAQQPKSGEIKYFLSNAPASADVEELVRAAFARWHVEKWFERAKQEAGLGAFEVRTYQSLIRHWLCCRLAMLFLAEETTRLRGEKSGDHIRAGGRSGEPVDLSTGAPRLAIAG
jgi:SRSO17 transposase